MSFFNEQKRLEKGPDTISPVASVQVDPGGEEKMYPAPVPFPAIEKFHKSMTNVTDGGPVNRGQYAQIRNGFLP